MSFSSALSVPVLRPPGEPEAFCEICLDRSAQGHMIQRAEASTCTHNAPIVPRLLARVHIHAGSQQTSAFVPFFFLHHKSTARLHSQQQAAGRKEADRSSLILAFFLPPRSTEKFLHARTVSAVQPLKISPECHLELSVYVCRSSQIPSNLKSFVILTRVTAEIRNKSAFFRL